MSRPGIEPVTSRSPERTLYQLSYRGRCKSKGKNESEVDELVANIIQGSKQKNRKKTQKTSPNSPEGEKSEQSEKRETLQRTIQGVETLPITNQCYNNSDNPSIQSYSQCSHNMSQQRFYSSQGNGCILFLHSSYTH